MCKAFSTTLKEATPRVVDQSHSLIYWLLRHLDEGFHCLVCHKLLQQRHIVGSLEHQVGEGWIIENLHWKIQQSYIEYQEFESQVMLHYMIMTLKLRSFTNDLCMTPPTNMQEMRLKTTKFIRLKEVKEYRIVRAKIMYSVERKGNNRDSGRKNNP